MALQLGALRNALLAANVPEDKAEKAAEEVASYEARIAATDSRLTLLTWMVGGLYAANAGIFWLVFKTAAKIGSVG